MKRRINGCCPIFGAEAEGFALLLASNGLPDIINVVWSNPGVCAPGPDAAIDNGLVLDMTGYEDLMPNYMATPASNEMLTKFRGEKGAATPLITRGAVKG